MVDSSLSSSRPIGGGREAFMGRLLAWSRRPGGGLEPSEAGDSFLMPFWLKASGSCGACGRAASWHADGCVIE